MLVREGDERTPGIDIRLAAMLAAVAGALNAAGFQATGFFSANMTGNVSALSDRIGLGRFGLAFLFCSLVVSFIAGSFVSGLLISVGRRRGTKAIYAYSIAAEAALLVGLSLIDLLLPETQNGTILALGLSCIMGLQNAATTRISNARVRTTHVSGMATDIGLGLAALVGDDRDRADAIPRLRLHLSTIASFIAGGIIGVAVYVMIDGWLLFVCAAILFAIAWPEARRAVRL